ncbi:MAG: DUF1993 domain-containing protein [Alphaproteobacteria bacterium]|nr:DUF1993 domain-containing protein [Alphaproteobacteria bacterium]
MAISLYDATVAGFIRTVMALEGVLAKGVTHCETAGIDAASVVDTRVHADMLPFRYQVVAMTQHSVGAINGARAGVFTPPSGLKSHDYKDLQALLAEARGSLEAMSPDEINALEGRDMEFRMGAMVMPFTVEAFLLSFSVPNFHFHAATAYGILRAKGVPLGKRDYLGQLPIRG